MGVSQNFVKADEQCSPQDVINFMNATQSFMDETGWVERYSWFGAMKELQGVNEVIGCAKYRAVFLIVLLPVCQNHGHRWQDQRPRSSVYRGSPAKHDW